MVRLRIVCIVYISNIYLLIHSEKCSLKSQMIMLPKLRARGKKRHQKEEAYSSRPPSELDLFIIPHRANHLLFQEDQSRFLANFMKKTISPKYFIIREVVGKVELIFFYLFEKHGVDEILETHYQVQWTPY